MRIPVSKLQVDTTYQRDPLKVRTILAMAETWDEKAAGTIVVSRRRDSSGLDKYLVIDGQQRSLAASLVGHPDIEAMVYEHLTLEEEAALFVKFNKNRTSVRADSVFRARLVARDPAAVAIVTAAAAVGLEVHSDRTANTICCVATMETLYTAGVLEATLREIRTIWPQNANALQATIVGGMGWILRLYQDEYASQKADIRHKLSTRDPRELTGTAYAYKGSTLHTGVGRALLSAINSGKRNLWPDRFTRAFTARGAPTPITVGEMTRARTIIARMRR